MVDGWKANHPFWEWCFDMFAMIPFFNFIYYFHLICLRTGKRSDAMRFVCDNVSADPPGQPVMQKHTSVIPGRLSSRLLCEFLLFIFLSSTKIDTRYCAAR